MMPSLQDLIYKFEEGEGVYYIKVALAVLALLVLAVLYNTRAYRNFEALEPMDAAQLARNVAEGKGYTTQFIRPLSVLLLQKKHGEGAPVLSGSHPDLSNPPVYPAVLAGLMKVFPFNFEIDSRAQHFWTYQPERLIAIFNQVIFVALLVMFFFLARRMFDLQVAWISVLVLAGANSFWRFSISGQSTLLLALIFLGLVWCLVRIEEEGREPSRSRRWILGMACLTGLLLALGALTRYSFAWLVLPVLLFVAFFGGQRKVQISLVALLVFGALMAPWLARNYQISGHFFGIASYAVYQETSAFPGTRMERYLTGDFEEALSKVDFYALMRKFLTNVPEVLQEELPRVGGSWVTAFFLAGLLVPFRNVALGRLRIFALLSLGLFVVVQALGKTHLSAASPEVNSENLLILAAPLVFMFGVALFITLLDQVEIPLPPLRSLVVGIFVLVVSAPLLFALLPPRSIPFAYPPIYWPPLVQQVGHFFSEDELMMSDMPWAVAWYGNRQCIWATLNAPGDPQFKRTREEQPVFQMPASVSKEKERERIEELRSDFYVIYDYHKPIHGIYLTRLTTDAQFYSEMVRNPDHAWGRFMLDALLKTNVPSGFPLRHATPGFLEEGQLLLMDRRRW